MSRLQFFNRLFSGVCFLFLINFSFGCSGHAEITDPDRNPGQLDMCKDAGKCVAPVPPGPLPQERRGVVNPRTGEYLQPSGKGLYNPRTGDYYQPTGNGYYNPKTGDFIPKR